MTSRKCSGRKLLVVVVRVAAGAVVVEPLGLTVFSAPL